jgi:O-antigen/teichoic acid export membrane protein
VTEGRIGRDSLLSGGSALAGLITGFGTVVLVAHDRGADTAGVLFGAIGLYTILATVAKLGTETTFVYYAGHLRGSTGIERRALAGLVRMGLVPVVAVSVLLASLLLVLADPLSQVLIDDAHRSEYAGVIRVLAPFVPVWAVTLPLLGVTRGLGDLRPTAVTLQVVQPLLQLALVGAALLADGSAAALAAGWAVPLLVTLASAARQVRRAVTGAPEAPRDQDVAIPPTREFWGHATPRGLAGTLSMAVDRLGVVLVGSLGSASLAGAWTAITRLLGICLRVVHAMSQALNTRLPALLAAGRQRAAMGQAHLATWWTIALLTPVLSVIAVFPEAALDLFGMEDIEGATSALRWATLAAGVAVVFAHVDNVLLMSGRSGLVLIDGIPSLAALIALSAWLVPGHGLRGAAWAWVVSTVAYRGLALVQVHAMYRRWVVTRRIAADGLRLVAATLLASVGLRALLGDGLPAAMSAGLATSLVALGQMWLVHRRPAPTDGGPTAPGDLMEAARV